MSALFRTAPSSAARTVIGARATVVSPNTSDLAPKHSSDVHVKKSVKNAKTVNSLDIQSWQAGVLSQGLVFRRHILQSPQHQQARFVHSGSLNEFPNFDKYRRESTKDPTQPARDSEDQRRAFTYAISYGAGFVLTAWAAKAAVHNIVGLKAMSDKSRWEGGPVEVNINSIKEGVTQTFKWRSQPIFVRHRTSAEIEKERAVNVSELRDPQSDDQRVKKPEWVVSLGVCTHLGCVPIAGKGDYGGYYCPCHGSHYDTAGRIRKGPAPLNLEIPPYSFKGDGTLIIGADE